MGQLSRLYSKLVFVISTAKSMCLPYSFVHSDKIVIIFNSEKYIHGNIFSFSWKLNLKVMFFNTKMNG